MKYYLSAMTGFLIWGTFALVLKPLGAFAALDILIYRVLFASVSILLACFLFRRKPTLQSIQYLRNSSSAERKKLLINILGSAILLGLNWFLFIYVMNNVSVNATSLAYLICPILTTVLANLFLKEHLNRGQWIAVGLSLISCIIMAYGHFVDLFYSFLIALSYAAYLVLQKNTFKLDKFFTLSIHILVSTILLLPILNFVDTETPKTDLFYLLIAVIAIFYTIVPLFLNIYALKGLDSSLVGILLYINPIISFCLAVWYYQEPINIYQISAFSLIILAICIFNISYWYEKRKNQLS
ncbi:EamA family transporter [Sphingobacterium sp. HJSM2_6]|uniref:EamA family transporter n=1 Tax=Sphingobacterium sp. HJSM2_6 TaxID=3366264 RepID=UPI003BEB1D84